jgi:hypothetical protein
MLLTKATLVIHLFGNEIAYVAQKFFVKNNILGVNNHLY